MSEMRKLLQFEKSVLVFDIDGTLCPYEYGQHNHNACLETEWQELMKETDVYESARPLKVFQDIIKTKGTDRVFICTQASGTEKEQKRAYVQKHYGIPAEQIFAVGKKTDKLLVLDHIKEMVFPELDEYYIIMVDDSISLLTYIQENSSYSTIHVSSFLE